MAKFQVSHGSHYDDPETVTAKDWIVEGGFVIFRDEHKNPMLALPASTVQRIEGSSFDPKKKPVAFAG